MTTPKKGHQLLLIDPSLDDSSSDSEVLITENADALTSTNSNHQILLIDPSLDDSSIDSDDFEDAKADYQSRQKDDPADDLQSSDNFIDFKCDEEFRRDIGLDSIKEKLRLLESDITKTEYSIVIAAFLRYNGLRRNRDATMGGNTIQPTLDEKSSFSKTETIWKPC
ncbi:uncharacterized protein [Magallana gigas]|uniref:uncharacterized protein n=1 Tax=Magallana gigas TaxID=29159 RepID=UPI00333EEF9C